MRKISKVERRRQEHEDTIIQERVVYEEGLPLPFVHYLQGPFIAFSREQDGYPILCKCSSSAVENATSSRLFCNYANELDNAIASQKLFPSKIARESLSIGTNAIKFEKNICHLCIGLTPTKTTGSKSSRFSSHFGWYIAQKRLAWGIGYGLKISETCPNRVCKLQQQIDDILKEDQPLRLERSELWDQLSDAPIESMSPTQTEKLKRANDLNQILSVLESESSKISREISNIIENEVRKRAGYRKVGDAWVGETMLANIVKTIYPETEIVRHYRPKWLEGLELDIYLPTENTAFEYQGQQHYQPVEHWGGKEALAALKKRDEKKKKLCKWNAVTLVEIRFDDPLNVKFIKSRIASAKLDGI
jgi:hypothetical protein